MPVGAGRGSGSSHWIKTLDRLGSEIVKLGRIPEQYNCALFVLWDNRRKVALGLWAAAAVGSKLRCDEGARWQDSPHLSTLLLSQGLSLERTVSKVPMCPLTPGKTEWHFRRCWERWDNCLVPTILRKQTICETMGFSQWVPAGPQETSSPSIP